MYQHPSQMHDWPTDAGLESDDKYVEDDDYDDEPDARELFETSAEPEDVVKSMESGYGHGDAQ
jgi:hypothetical protein